jgi:hypothetical protein
MDTIYHIGNEFLGHPILERRGPYAARFSALGCLDSLSLGLVMAFIIL